MILEADGHFVSSLLYNDYGPLSGSDTFRVGSIPGYQILSSVLVRRFLVWMHGMPQLWILRFGRPTAGSVHIFCGGCGQVL